MSVETLERREVPASIQSGVLDVLFLERLNDLRAARGNGPLAFDPAAKAAARQIPDREVDPAGFQNYKARKASFAAERVIYNPTKSLTWGQDDLPTTLRWSDGTTALAFDPEAHIAMFLEARTGFIPSVLTGNQVSAKHRSHRSIGVDYQSSPDTLDLRYITFAPTSRKPILTGSVFRDLNQNGKYDVGEGLKGVTIGVSGQKSVRGSDSGGYTLTLKRPGALQVTASGGDLGMSVTLPVKAVSGTNTRLNFLVS